MTKAFVMLTADRVETGAIGQMGGAVQQEVRLYQGDMCVCSMLVTYPPGSPAWEAWTSSRTLDFVPAVNSRSVASDVVPDDSRDDARSTRHYPSLEGEGT